MSMHKKLRRWSIIGIVIIFGLAAFWHFLFELLPCNVTAAVSPVNESPWEHAKLFFIPAILFYIVQYFIIGKQYPNYIFAHSIALLVMPVFMLLLYYAYSTLLPIEETLVFDLINTLLTISLGSLIGYRLTISENDMNSTTHHIAAMVIIIGMLVIYTVFTFNPPMYDMFYDKSQMKYGI